MAKKPTKKVQTAQTNQIVDFTPQPGKQEYAMNTNTDVMIFGGAAGCVDKDTEYLSKDGWKKISEYKDGEKIYQYHPYKRKKLQLVEPLYQQYEMKDNFYCIENSLGIHQVLSMEHRFVFFSKKKSKKPKEVLVGDLIAFQQNEPLSGYIDDGNGNRIPFNIRNKPHTFLKIYEHISEDNMKYCFETPSSFVLFRRNDHVFVTGNSGKSRLLLLKALKYAYNDPLFGGVLFRRQTPALKASGGLWPEAKKLYAPMKPTVREQALEMEFVHTKGGTLKFTHLEHESTAEDSH